MVYQRLKPYLSVNLNRFYPGRCVLCGQSRFSAMDICPPCLEFLPAIRIACRQCGRPLAHQPDTLVCGQCIKYPSCIDQTLALYTYQEPISWLIYALKYRARLCNARLLSSLWLRQFHERINPLPDIIVPIPLHPRRLRHRGFNQAAELAKPIGKRLGIPVDYRICKRIIDTVQQTELPAIKRRANVKNAFEVSQELEIESVALLDDVITTGSTVNEAAALLKKKGVKHVQVWAIARAE